MIDREGVYDQLNQTTIPTLIVVGDQDVATPPKKSKRIQASIPGVKLVPPPVQGIPRRLKSQKRVRPKRSHSLSTH
ncbi:MAG: hypothetical protein AAF629_17370 [Chloroflexota bacterium]